jgi:hypothetical protein
VQEKSLYSKACQCGTVLLLIFSIITSKAQQTSTATVQPSSPIDVVEYNWGEGQFLNVMPFDDPFSLKISGIPENIDSISINLYEIRGNYNLFKDNKKSITYEDFLRTKNLKKYGLKTWKRTSSDQAAPIYFAVPYHLHPNSKYIVEIVASSIVKASDAQQEQLQTMIENSKPIRDLISHYVTEYIKYNKSFHDLTEFINELNTLINNEAKGLNNSFVFQPPTNEDLQLESVADFFKNLIQLDLDLKTLEKNAKNTSPYSLLNCTKTEIENTKFGNFVFDSSARVTLNNLFQSIDSINTLSAAATNKKEDVVIRYKKINSLIANLVKHSIENLAIQNIFEIVPLASNYPVNMTAQADRYLGLDFGNAYIYNFSRFQTYYGINIYLRPVNKNIPLSRYKNIKDFFLVRTSLLLGLTFSSIEKIGIRKGIVSDKGVIIGTGFRIVSFFRVNGGGLIYYRYPANPLLDPEKYSAAISPFISASFDLDMEALLGAVGKSIFPAKSSNQ